MPRKKRWIEKMKRFSILRKGFVVGIIVGAVGFFSEVVASAVHQFKKDLTTLVLVDPASVGNALGKGVQTILNRKDLETQKAMKVVALWMRWMKQRLF